MIIINNTDISEYVKLPEDCILLQEIDSEKLYKETDNVCINYPIPESYKLVIRLKKYNFIKDFIYSTMRTLKEYNFHIQVGPKNCEFKAYPIKFEPENTYEEMLVPLHEVFIGRKIIYERRIITIYNAELTFKVIDNNIRIF